MTFVIRNHIAFQGPNIWSHFPVTHLIVDANSSDCASRTLPRLDDWYAALSELVHQEVPLPPRYLAESDGIGAELALMTLNLQRTTGVSVEFCFGGKRADGGFDVVVQHGHAQIGLSAARLATRWLTHLLDPVDSEFDVLADFTRFAVVVQTTSHGDAGRSIAMAAAQRGIPLATVDPRGRVVELGNGRYRRHISGPLTALTSTISIEIARDKHLTNHFLRAAGLPVPDSIVARSLDQVLAAAHTLGYPVAIKPLDLGNAVGVSVDLRNDDEIRASFGATSSAAATSSGKILVERFVQGNDYRALIVNDRLSSVRQRLRPEITGDGVLTVQQLIDRENGDPRRGTRASDSFKAITVDESVFRILAQLGLSLDSVPVHGQRIELNFSGNRRNGAIHIDCTDDVHPQNVDLLRAAANIIGLEIAGIDIITPDIAQPMLETGGAIIEVNDCPAFNLHLFSLDKPGRDPGPMIVEMLFPAGQPVRVPVVAIVADDNSARGGNLTAAFLASTGRAIGLATRDGVAIGQIRLAHVDPRNPAGPRTLLNNPLVEMAVVEVDAESIVEHGLGFDLCDVAVIRSLSGSQTPFGQPVETVLLRALDPAGVAVLDASNPDIRALAADLDVSVILVNLNPDDPRLDELLDEKTRAVVIRNDAAGAAISVVSNDARSGPLTFELPYTAEENAAPLAALETLQVAIAIAVALNIPIELIQQHLRTD